MYALTLLYARIIKRGDVEEGVGEMRGVLFTPFRQNKSVLRLSMHARCLCVPDLRVVFREGDQVIGLERGEKIGRKEGA